MSTASKASPMMRAFAIPRGPLYSAQLGALMLGTWWTVNGIGAFIAEPGFDVSHVHGEANLGLVHVAVNGWHALFHLLTGLLCIAVWRKPRAARACLIGTGVLYLIVAGWGLINGSTVFGVMAVDTPGSVVHAIEGLIALAIGILVLRRPSGSPLAPVR